MWQTTRVLWPTASSKILFCLVPIILEQSSQRAGDGEYCALIQRFLYVCLCYVNPSTHQGWKLLIEITSTEKMAYFPSCTTLDFDFLNTNAHEKNQAQTCSTWNVQCPCQDKGCISYLTSHLLTKLGVFHF